MKTLITSMAIGLAAVALANAAPKIGEAAPSFTLKDTNGKEHSLAELKGKYVILEWINHGCPYVKKHYDSGNMQSLQKEAASQGAVWLSVCSSAPGKQGNMSPDEWNKAIAEKKMAAAAVLIDEDGKVGKLYDAKTTPHMFVINPEGKLVYAGGIDNKNTSDKKDLDGASNYVRAALTESMAGKPVSNAETKPYGCSVKY